MTSRSRSSLVSKIFINHGVWWGDTPAEINGYQMNENQNIKRLLSEYKRKYWKKIHLTPVDPKWNQSFMVDLSRITPNDRQWMMKTGVEYFNAFRDLNPHNIFVYRPATDVAKSLCQKRPDVNYDDALKAAEWRFNYMRNLSEKHGGAWVDTDFLLKENFIQIKRAIEMCGLTYDDEAVRAAIR